jgi:hypothetical protein
LPDENLIWNDAALELEIVDPTHVSYVPLQGNRVWALLPTSLDWYCYYSHLPNFMRVLRRLGLYLQVGDRKGTIQAVLDDVHAYYGANYLRISGRRGDLSCEIRLYPDAEESLLYLTVALENRGPAAQDVRLVLAADFEIHFTGWARKGFTEDATEDYSGLERKLAIPHDDHIERTDTVFFASDARNPGAGFVATQHLAGWTLDRARFCWETPLSGYRVHQLLEGALQWSNEARSDDSLCVLGIDVRLEPGQTCVEPLVFGYQERPDATLALAALARWQSAFEQTRARYQAPMRQGVKVHTPDPMVNAQFSLYNLFVKLNEHHCGDKTGFLPGAHYFDWLCGDSMMALPGYAFANDWEPIKRGLDLFRREQHADGFIPNLPLWRGGPSWRERGDLPCTEAANFVVSFCGVIRIIRDRALAEAYLPSLQKAMQCVLTFEKEGLIYPGGYNGFDAIDWPCSFGGAPQTFISVFTYKALSDLAALCEWLGEQPSAVDLRHRASTLKATINQKLWMGDRGHYRVGLALGNEGKDDRDRELFSRDMLSSGSLVAAVWGVADDEQSVRVIRNVRERLWSPLGVKFLDPPWAPNYVDPHGPTYAAGRQINGGYWLCWYTMEYLVRAEILQGQWDQAFEDLCDIRLDTTYRRCTMTEKGRALRFVRSGEWIDYDLTFPVTSIPYTLSAAFFNQTLIEAVLGITVAYDRLVIEPHLPSAWPGASLTDLTIGDSVWDIQIHGRGPVRRIVLDGQAVSALPITPGRHHVEISCG